MWPMLRRSTCGPCRRCTLWWNGGGGAFMCQRSTRKPSLQPLHRHRLGHVGVLFRAAQRLGVHEGQVREVAQVVDDQQLVGVVVQVAGNALPLRIAQVGEVEDVVPGRPAPDRPSRSTPGGRARPPDSCCTPSLAGTMSWPGIWMHLPRGIELQAVVHAADAIAFAPAQRQRGAAVAAAIPQRDHLAALALVEQHPLFQDACAAAACRRSVRGPRRRRTSSSSET